MDVLITGASGFVGQSLSGFLEGEQHTVHTLSLRDRTWKQHFPKEIDAVIHLAAKLPAKNGETLDESEYYWINRDLTLEVFKQFLDSEARDFFFFSSVKAIAESFDGVLTEQTVGYPRTPYGLSKYEAENKLLSTKLPEGKRLFIIRPCLILGSPKNEVLNYLFRRVQKGRSWSLANFHIERSFLSPENLNYLIGEMLKNENLPSGIYNFADDKPLSVNQLLDSIWQCLDKPTRFRHLSPSVVHGIARVGDMFHLPFNSKRLQKLTDNLLVSNQKIKDALGIECLPYSPRKGLLRTLIKLRNEMIG